MRRLLLALLLLLSAGAPSAAWAADQTEADADAAQGLDAMKDSDADPHRGVDAAISFSHALSIYKDLGLMDQVAEMQSNIFWCKKRMNIDDLEDYLAKKGAAASSAFTAAKAVMDTQVPVSEADSYLDKAKQYQASSPDKHFQIAIRFSEIIERFPDTDAAKAAEPIFVAEQSAYLSQVSKERATEKQELQQAIDQVQSTRFMAAAAAVAGTTAIPAEADRNRALTAIKTAYHDAYQIRTQDGKRALAQRLLTESDSNKDDAAYFYMMLAESERLALESAEWEIVLAAIEKTGEFFVGYDVQAHKKEAFGRERSDQVANAIYLLLGNPNDKAANLTAGRGFCLGLGRFDLGLPMLADGTDGDLKKAAQLELTNPQLPGEQKALGDLWYGIGHHVSSAERLVAWDRARTWYRRALPGLGALHQQELQGRMDEIDDALPQTDLDWDHLTEKQWNRLKGDEIDIESKVDRSNGDVDIDDDHRVRVVPFPDDKKKMVFMIGTTGPRQHAGILTGEGHLWVFPTTPRRGATDDEILRFKIIPVTGP